MNEKGAGDGAETNRFGSVTLIIRPVSTGIFYKHINIILKIPEGYLPPA
jgi:hypothetical protein